MWRRLVGDICTEQTHVFPRVSRSLGVHLMEYEPTKEIRIKSFPMTGKGRNRGTVRVAQRKYVAYMTCNCGQKRRECGTFWKTEDRQVIWRTKE